MADSLKNSTKQNKNNGSPIHYKSLSGNFKADAAGRKVSGYFAAFNTLDSAGDIIRPGAFAKSIQERGPGTSGNRKIKYLHQHIIKEISGPLTKLYEDSYGLGFEGEIEKTPLGDVILERYSNGTYNEHSIGFNYVWDMCGFVMVPLKDMPGYQIDPAAAPEIEVFECRELNLFEGSVVTFGANSETPFSGFKGSNEDLQKALTDELSYLISKSPSYEYELQLRHLWAKQMSLVQSLAEKITKETIRPIKAKGMDYAYLSNNFKL